jgi:predicted ArsR family transcriptional regulator
MPSGTSPKKPNIRQRILHFLKTRGKALITDVAKHFRISHEGARKQLAQMESEGWIERNEATAPSGGIGRPNAPYSVTNAGDHLFPKSYDGLSSALISALKDSLGPEALRTVLAALAQKQVEDWEPLMKGKTPIEKLNALRGLYLKNDPFMSVEEKDGDLILIERNCPFLNVAMEHPALCSLSVSTLEKLLGHPVVREERFQAGNGRCVFRVKLDRSQPKKGFRFEAEKPA